MIACTAERERRAVVQHVARCRFCQALLAHSRRRSDHLLLDTADQLAAEHAANDAERMAFAKTRRTARAGGR